MHKNDARVIISLNKKIVKSLNKKIIIIGSASAKYLLRPMRNGRYERPQTSPYLCQHERDLPPPQQYRHANAASRPSRTPKQLQYLFININNNNSPRRYIY